LLSPTLQIPTGRITEVGKQGVNAGLVLRAVKIEIGLAALLGNSVIALYSDYSKSLAITRNPEANREIISRVDEREEQDCQTYDPVHPHHCTPITIL
jgi:hypothetical protein